MNATEREAELTELRETVGLTRDEREELVRLVDERQQRQLQPTPVEDLVGDVMLHIDDITGDLTRLQYLEFLVLVDIQVTALTDIVKRKIRAEEVSQ